MCSLAPRPKMLNYLLSFKPVELLNKMVYFHELKLLQKRKLSQLQIYYLFSINRNMAWWKNLKLLLVVIPIILIQLVYISCMPHLVILVHSITYHPTFFALQFIMYVQNEVKEFFVRIQMSEGINKAFLQQFGECIPLLIGEAWGLVAIAFRILKIYRR